MTGRNILAIDLGTTAAKCALYSTSGMEVASATQEYELQTAAPGHDDVDVEVYWTSIRDCLADYLPLVSRPISGCDSTPASATVTI